MTESVDSQLPSTQSDLMPKWHTLGWPVLIPVDVQSSAPGVARLTLGNHLLSEQIVFLCVGLECGCNRVARKGDEAFSSFLHCFCLDFPTKKIFHT